MKCHVAFDTPDAQRTLESNSYNACEYVFPPADTAGCKSTALLSSSSICVIGYLARLVDTVVDLQPAATAPPFFWKKNQNGRAVADIENEIFDDRLVRGTGFPSHLRMSAVDPILPEFSLIGVWTTL